ncbi:MAG: hypothetical protein RL562_232 [Planctomycetota bacterium]|jgi:hypothetical protein
MTAVPPRLEELLADRVLWGLDEDESRELEAFGAQAERELQAYELASAEVISAFLPAQTEDVPPHVLARLRSSAADYIAHSRGDGAARGGAARSGTYRPAASRGSTPGARTESPAPASPILMWSGWLAAAALLIAWMFGVRSPEPAPITEQLAMLQRSAGVQRLDWQSGPEGEVVWSAAEQRGFLVLKGLPANDPTEAQYQLWIFDRTRSESHPIDGGVFDVTGDGRAVIAIDAKLPVRDAFGFAITREVPGGVVVSARGADGTGTIVASAGL